MRVALGTLFAAAVAALGALILGEYPYSGLLVIVSGVLLGLFVGEAFLAVARWRGPMPAAVCAALTAAAMVWGGWIATGHELSLVAASGWVAVVAGPVAAALRVAWRSPAGTRPEPTPSE